jgi:hypothetical protein
MWRGVRGSWRGRGVIIRMVDGKGGSKFLFVLLWIERLFRCSVHLGVSRTCWSYQVFSPKASQEGEISSCK